MSKASEREGNHGVFLRATSCLAVQTLSGEVFARKSAQIGGFSPSHGFKVTQLALSCYSIGVGDAKLLGLGGGLCEFLSEGG